MFLRQKKETKRKISFFMATALVFSLIPAPSMVNAEETLKATLQGSVGNATIKFNNNAVVSGNSISISSEGTATITVEANNGYIFNSENDVTLLAETIVEPDETTKPSVTPSTEPTDEPSVTPSTEPTSGPSVTPSTEPTNEPSVTPSTEPTNEPSVTPSTEPTSGPSVTPSAEPTSGPSVTPSAEPTSGPSVTPSTEPASGPSVTASGGAAKVAAYSIRTAVADASLNKTKTVITFTLSGITENILVRLSGNATKAADDTKSHTVKFNSSLIKASYEAICDEEKLQTNSSVTGGSIISLNVIAGNNCIFKEAPVVMVNGSNAELTPNKTKTSYSVKNGIKITSDTTIDISGKAFEKYNVTIKDASGTLKNATLTATYNNKEFTGGEVLEGDTVILKITPEAGYAFNTIPIVKAGTVNVPAGNFEKTAGGAYNVSVTIKADTELSVSGEAELQKITDASPAGNANNASLEETNFKDEKILESFLDAFANNSSVNEETAKKIKEAVSKSEAYIQASINVTGASAEAKTEANTLIKENASIGIDADNLTDENSAFLDITLESICKKVSDNSTMASIIVEKLDNKIAVTMDLPAFKKVSGNKNKNYIVIRIHGSKAEKLPDNDVIVNEDTGKIKFFSDKFSTYVITFEDKETPSATPSNTPAGTTKPVIPSVYNPVGGGSSTSTATPVPSTTPVPSATPGTEPSKTPDAASSPAPGTTDTAKPSENPAEPGTTNRPGATPEATKQPSIDDGKNVSSSSKIKVGKNVTISNTKYKVTSISGTKAVQFTSAKKNAKKVVIPSTVKISGKKFKVTSIANNALKGNKKITKLTIGTNINKIGKNAFKGCSSLKSITIKSKKLTAKKTGKNAFKGINKKAVIKVPKAKTKAYKKIIKSKGAPKTIKVKK